jgi:hypothetical protein
MPADGSGLPTWIHKARRPFAVLSAYRAPLGPAACWTTPDNPPLAIAPRSLSALCEDCAQ